MKRDDVFFPLFGSTHSEICAQAWKAGVAFYAHEGEVWLVLGPGASDLDWFNTGVRVNELVR